MQSPFELSYWITSATGLVHFIAAIICLGLGPFIFIRHKGDGIHKLMGRIWALAMLILNVSALLTYELGSLPNLFHFFAIVSLVTLILGWRSIRSFQRRGNIQKMSDHREYMAWAYYGLMAAGVWQVVISLARIDVINVPYNYLYNGLGALTALTAVALFMFFRARPLKY